MATSKEEQDFVNSLKRATAPADGARVTLSLGKKKVVITRDDINSTIGAYIATIGSDRARYSWGQSNSKASNASNAWAELKKDLIANAWRYIK